MNSVPITPRKDDQGNTGPNTDRKRARNNPRDNDGWTSAPTCRCPAFTVQSDKLKNKPPQIDEPLGSFHMFGTWGRGSNIKTTAPPPPPNTGNMYAALENIANATDKRTGLGSRPASKDPYNSKGPSLERNYKHSSYEGECMSVPITPRKDDRGNTGPNTDRKHARNNPSDNDGWTSAPTRRCPAFTVQSDKLKNKPPQIDEPLGSFHMFGNWGHGSNIKTTAPPPPPNTGNMYAALENIGNETDKRTGLGSRPASKDPYNSKGPSLERNYKHSSYEGECMSVPITPRKDDRGNTGPNTDRKHARNNPSDNDGWTSAPTRRCPAFTVQSDKLKNKPPQIDEPLRSYHMFGNWGRGSNIKTTAPPPPPNTGNMYAALENIGNETDKRTGLGSRSASKDPYNSKGPNLERNYKHSSYEDGRGSRSGSQHRSNDNSQRITPTPCPSKLCPKHQIHLL